MLFSIIFLLETHLISHIRKLRTFKSVGAKVEHNKTITNVDIGGVSNKILGGPATKNKKSLIFAGTTVLFHSSSTCLVLYPWIAFRADSVRWVALCAEVTGHRQEQLSQTLVCLLKRGLFYHSKKPAAPYCLPPWDLAFLQNISTVLERSKTRWWIIVYACACQ